MSVTFFLSAASLGFFLWRDNENTRLLKADAALRSKHAGDALRAYVRANPDCLK